MPLYAACRKPSLPRWVLKLSRGGAGDEEALLQCKWLLLLQSRIPQIEASNSARSPDSNEIILPHCGLPKFPVIFPNIKLQPCDLSDPLPVQKPFVFSCTCMISRFPVRRWPPIPSTRVMSLPEGVGTRSLKRSQQSCYQEPRNACGTTSPHLS